MPRGCHNKKAPLSTAKRQAERKPSANSKPKAKPTTIVDDRPSQRLPDKPPKAPEWAKPQKGDHEKIAGTRVQCGKGGITVRVVIEDGKVFPPHKVAAVKKHLKKLEQKAELQREIDRIHTTDGPIDPASLLSSVGSRLKKVASGAEAAKASATAAVSITVPQTKKERKRQQYEEWLRRQAAMHAAKAEEAGRELVSHEWHDAKVLLRSEGSAWVELASSQGLSDAVRAKMDERAKASQPDLMSSAGAEGRLLAVSFADIADKTLQLQPGAQLQLKVFRDRDGVGGCEARALESRAEPQAASCPADSVTSPSTAAAGSLKRPSPDREGAEASSSPKRGKLEEGAQNLAAAA
mmetsp:Transcript_48545/g.115390  ORF Transcript_48545/g.115390 Transcript_48545/m.115390 type:complete len:351 (-) Transcript_48545:51-1103(-)